MRRIVKKDKNKYTWKYKLCLVDWLFIAMSLAFIDYIVWTIIR